MNKNNLLINFETKYSFLYCTTVNGFPIYTCFREHIQKILRDGAFNGGGVLEVRKGRIYPMRLLGGLFKFLKLRRAETVIFTSSIYRRDRGRNLAVEYLIERYPQAVVFEWPSRNDEFDAAYFSDEKRKLYCPLDFYVIRYKIKSFFSRLHMRSDAAKIRDKLKSEFDACPPPETKSEAAAINYLLDNLPESFASMKLSQDIFRKMFRKYRFLNYAIDLWGSARENIFPVLPGSPEKIELQHGLISPVHPGYIYPEFVKELNLDFFKRSLLVYGDGTKKILSENSIFIPDNIEVIGNPRIIKYKAELLDGKKEKKLILFASQTYEQDGTADGYYKSVIPILRKVDSILNNDNRWYGFRLGVKLHPRENNIVAEMYKRELPNALIFDNTSQLYELLAKAYLQITVSSTTLFEAAEFGTPTVQLEYNGIDSAKAYGFDVISINNQFGAEDVLSLLSDPEKYREYSEYIIKEARLHL